MTDTPAPKKPETPKSYPVAVLKFFQPHPGFNAQSSISVSKETNRDRYVIEFVPSLRHHRVECHKPGQAMKVFMVPECHVASWEPAA